MYFGKREIFALEAKDSRFHQDRFCIRDYKSKVATFEKTIRRSKLELGQSLVYAE